MKSLTHVPTFPCPNCHGMGEIRSSTTHYTKPCLVCSGVGQVTQERACSRCQGYGELSDLNSPSTRYTKPCPVCNPKNGLYLRYVARQSKHPTEHPTEHPNCGGYCAFYLGPTESICARCHGIDHREEIQKCILDSTGLITTKSPGYWVDIMRQQSTLSRPFLRTIVEAIQKDAFEAGAKMVAEDTIAIRPA